MLTPLLRQDSPGWPGTHKDLPASPAECWDYRNLPPNLAIVCFLTITLKQTNPSLLCTSIPNVTVPSWRSRCCTHTNTYISNSCCYYVWNEHSLILILQKLGNKEVVVPLFHCFGTSETQILLYTDLDSCVKEGSQICYASFFSQTLLLLPIRSY